MDSIKESTIQRMQIKQNLLTGSNLTKGLRRPYLYNRKTIRWIDIMIYEVERNIYYVKFKPFLLILKYVENTYKVNHQLHYENTGKRTP